MKRYFLIIVSLFLLSYSYAQVETYTTVDLSALDLFKTGNARGNVVITQDSRLNDFIKAYIDYQAHQPIRGWRVQIFFGTGHNARTRAEQIRGQFLAEYPDIPVYITYEQPYFKVRVGNFIDRISASKFLFLIKEEYPKAFLTEDKIDFDKLTQ